MSNKKLPLNPLHRKLRDKSDRDHGTQYYKNKYRLLKY